MSRPLQSTKRTNLINAHCALNFRGCAVSCTQNEMNEKEKYSTIMHARHACVNLFVVMVLPMKKKKMKKRYKIAEKLGVKRKKYFDNVHSHDYGDPALTFAINFSSQLDSWTCSVDFHRSSECPFPLPIKHSC